MSTCGPRSGSGYDARSGEQIAALDAPFHPNQYDHVWLRRSWADHNVRTHGAGTKRFNHPVVGELTLAYEELAVTAEPGLVLLV